MLADFHFIRSLWLLLLPLIPLLLVGLWQYRSSGASWQTLIAPGLRDYLIDGHSGRLSKWLFITLGCGWLLGVLALAGPAWQRLPQPVYQTGDAMVIVADLSPSMLARDVAPSRLERMRYKLTDLIKAREEGMTALVVYAGDSHVLAPLSDDRQTLLALLPGLSPQIMPIPGSHTEEAVALALDLFKQDNRRQGHVVLLTDGVTAQAARGVNELFAGLPAGTDFSLSVMGIGTAEGAPIPLTEGFAKDAAGKIVVARLDAQRLSLLAADNGGIYTAMQLDNSDTDALLNVAAGLLPGNGSDREGENQQAAEQTFDQWQEAGSWLLLLLLPIAALAFRRGWLLAVSFAFIVPAVHSPQVTAAEAGNSLWDNLWQTPDQQGAKALTAGDAATAAELFQRADWQAAARYRNGDYAAAAEQFAAEGSTEGLYNSGNALAKAGKLNEALAAYEQVLEQQPEHEDAQVNKALIEKLMQQQQNQNQQGEGQDQQDQNQQGQQDQNQQGESQQSQNQQSQQDQNQQGENQQSQDQQDQNQQGQQDQNQQGDNQQNQSQQAQDQQQSDLQDQAEQLSQQVDQQQQEALDKQQAEKAADESQAEQQDGAQVPVQAEQQSSPEDEALQKWLGQLPEDPAGLLRNKFNYEYQKKRQAYESGDWKPAQEQRW